MAPPGVEQAPSPWASHRRRAAALREPHPFAAEMLTLYLALLDVWDEARDLVRSDRPEPPKLAGWAADRVLPRVVTATEAAGPAPLASAAGQLGAADGIVESLTVWLAGGELPPVERYLARATLTAPLIQLDADAALACADDPAPRDERHCPRCGGPPQYSFRTGTPDRLVAGRRYLACARCANAWSHSASACPSCGETTGSRRTMYAERRDGAVVGRDGDAPADAVTGEDSPAFPHLRVDACDTCQRYLIDIDLGREARAVPEVDEMLALPLDLYAAERGLSKVTPNLMGF